MIALRPVEETATCMLHLRVMECYERPRLLGDCNRAALALSITVDELLHGVDAGSSIIYDRRRHAAEKARVGFELAQRTYETHVDWHGCEPTRLADATQSTERFRSNI
jgi:hypothetical protein